MRQRLTPASSRAKAEKCRRAAALSSDPAIKSELRKLAEEFEDRARVLETAAREGFGHASKPD
ncbi:hypothetical protein [Brevundimonas goettingensis]|uniref:Uncharacterized protein n=1 Tax=Brevundimonas goettingensis TaxID=2774190 RepID=A0A975GXC5_9CAUL|nr:hypothetical protein [Brevundimonas goettingensis]QTC92783.1 hypothetical protein IFJ75_08000 [Brevundimonas goettingensis]